MHDLSVRLEQGARRPSSAARPHRGRLVAVTVLGVLGWGLASAPPAGAAAVDVICAGTQHVALSPGLLLLTPRDSIFTVNEVYAPCVSPSNPGVTSAVSSRSWLARSVSCLALTSPNSFSKVLTWNTGQTSTFQFNQVATSVGGNSVVTLTGTITAGLFAWSTAVETIIGPANSWECLFEPGLRNRFTVLNLVITSP